MWKYICLKVVLGQLPPRKIAPNLNSNPNPKPNPNPNPNQGGGGFLEGNCLDTLESIDKEATRKEKNLFTFLYYESQIKSRDFSPRKQNEGNLKQ